LKQQLFCILLLLFSFLQNGCGTLNGFLGKRGIGIEFGEKKPEIIGTSIDTTSKSLAKPIRDEDIPPSVTITPPDVYPDDDVN
jgi:hypothetical protein